MGCTILSDAKIDKEIDNRLAKANSAFGRLYKFVWNNKSLKCKTKISVYRASVLSTLLYGVSISIAFIPSSTSTGATLSPMSRSSNRLKFPALKPYCQNTSSRLGV